MMRIANRQQHRRTALLNAVMMPSSYFWNGGLSGSGTGESALNQPFTEGSLEPA
jgi:hypothetical protein